ncbi:MAG: hypothetical protein WBH18_07985, partial [Lentibacter algarum]
TGAGQAGTKEAAEITYSMGDYAFHVSTNGTDTEYAASATMSGWTVGLAYADNGTNGDKTVLSGSFAAGAATNI